VEVTLKDSTDIRNLAFLSHAGAGKTSLAEAMLYNAKTVDRLGRIEEGTTTLDFEPQEISRKMSLNLSVATFNWKEALINLLDAPGYFDFVGDTLASCRAVDSSILLVDATVGTEPGTERMWECSQQNGLSKMIFINKMGKESADFYKSLETAKAMGGNVIVPLQLPIGAADNFSGIVDLLRLKAYSFSNGGSKAVEVPDDLSGKVEEFRKSLIESIAEKDDALLESYFDTGELSASDMLRVLRESVSRGELVPVLCGDAYLTRGVDLLMDAVYELLPSPGQFPPIVGKLPDSEKDVERKREDGDPLSCFAFKSTSEPHVGDLIYIRVYSGKLEPGTTVFNANKGTTEKINQIYSAVGKRRKEVTSLPSGQIGVLVKLRDTKAGDTLCTKEHPIVFPSIEFPRPFTSVAILPKGKGDEEKLSTALTKLSEEDPTFKAEYDTELKQILAHGIGELHLDVKLERLEQRFGVAVDIAKPKIPYRETLTRSTEVQGKYKKQSGGRGQYGDVWIRIEPTEKGGGFEFVNKIVGGAIPSKYIPAVEKGVKEALRQGVLAGYPTVDVKITLYDGSFHDVDSSDIAFQIAGSMAFKKGALQCSPILLEPILEVEVFVPESDMGQVIGDLNSRRGKISSMEQEGRLRKIKALVPRAEMYKYSAQLKTMTQGRGLFTQKFGFYEEVPRELQDKVVKESTKEE
jgi:elongation factor G